MDEQKMTVALYDADEMSRVFLSEVLDKWLEKCSSFPNVRIVSDPQDLKGFDLAHCLCIGGDSGVVAYRLERPLRLGALFDRLSYIARRTGLRRQERVFSLGVYIIDPVSRRLEDCDGEVISDLTDKECELLMVLNEAKGAVVARDVLLNEVWGYGAGLETHTLETHVYRLRQKIERDPALPVYLMTAQDGYYLNGLSGAVD